jgi:crotonobetainyl-CoA:carnitine CoA-transferase CaiB-like acyl-CoA transferase
LIADIAGGAYPAVINILLALKLRDSTQLGSYLDISMTDNLFTFQYWGLGDGWRGSWPVSGNCLVTGGSPRYQIYRTADDRFLAAAPLEDKFWSNFLRLLGLDESTLPGQDADRIKALVAEAIRRHPAQFWVERFHDQDVCTASIVTLEEACKDPHYIGRGLFDRRVCSGSGGEIPALPVPVVDTFRSADRTAAAPSLGSGAQEQHTWPTPG